MTLSRISDPTVLGNVLRAARARSGLTQTQLAERLETSQRYISEMESGKRVTAIVRLLETVDELGATLYIDIPEGEGTLSLDILATDGDDG
ncbi:helix-turn-helix transcriptional regulator [uncultured Microbacterium sp.]|uniref:helix-turn-helix transcriptional regulator n=1 Tax=uncultured Microbacterium sp. TaxID=191216 RepID=UPI002638DA0D|nr:helix-turn-helix transcriptional regulator [uncultured Microbacterium sp.]